MKIGLHISALLFCGFAAAPVAAQQDRCDAISSIAQLEGGYRVTNGPGHVINVPGTASIPGPATATSDASLVLNGDSLELVTNIFGTMDVSFDVVNNPDYMWNFQESDVFESASSEQISVEAGCMDPARLMRINGHGTTELPDVGRRPVTIELIVFPNGHLIGRMDVVMVDPNITLQTRFELAAN